MYPNFSSFTLTGTTLIEGQGNFILPFTITLKSSDVTRKIELSTDGGTEYFLPIIDITTATSLIVTIQSPITHVKVTGVVGDKLIMVG
jgi:hypothetical protein